MIKIQFHCSVYSLIVRRNYIVSGVFDGFFVLLLCYVNVPLQGKPGLPGMPGMKGGEGPAGRDGQPGLDGFPGTEVKEASLM